MKVDKLTLKERLEKNKFKSVHLSSSTAERTRFSAVLRTWLSSLLSI